MTRAAQANSDTLRWREMDRLHLLHPFTQYKSYAKEGGRIIVKAQGVWLWDSEGEKILDGMAGLWCVNIGYGRKELAEAAYRQMCELPYYNAFFKTATPPSAELAQTLSEIAPEGFDHVFFCNSGSEANETIIKIVRHYWNLRGKKTKKTMIARRFAYHGVTLGAASLSGLADMHPQFDLPLPGFVHIEGCYPYREGKGMSLEEYGLHAARKLEAKIEELGPENVGAFIAEPIYGAGGVMVPPDNYFPEIRRICTNYDVLLIADEVICGFGRTGKWFGSLTFDIRPDLMTLAKGLSSGYLPIAGVMVGKKVADVLLACDDEFVHGFTYSAHPVSCAVALENLRILREEKIVEKAGTETGPYFQKKLKALEDHPLVGEVRGKGMIAAVELVADKKARKPFEPEGETGRLCRSYCWANNVVIRATRDSMLFSPPLVISRGEIDELIARFRSALDKTAKDKGIKV